MIAIVWARNAKINAQHHPQKMATELGQNNLIIECGMARGVDNTAHRGTLQNGTIDETAVNNVRATLLRDLSFDPF